MIKEEHPYLDVGLGLALGLVCEPGGRACGGINHKRPRKQQPAPVQFPVLFPSHSHDHDHHRDDDDHNSGVPRDRHPSRGLSGLSLNTPPDEEEDSVDKDPSAGGSGSRKKLRLSKDQSALLEESFRHHTTLNPGQKQELAQSLNLRPRQVEVWFQNRRARTKLKQTEVDCELLKKYCEKLSDENRRLKRELQELRSLRTGNLPFFLQLHKPPPPLAAATGALCPSCERVVTPVDGRTTVPGGAVLTMPASGPKLYSCAAAIKDSSSSVACCK